MSGTKNAERPAGLRRFRPYPAYKDSGVEWLGEIPAGWEVKPPGRGLARCWPRAVGAGAHPRRFQRAPSSVRRGKSANPFPALPQGTVHDLFDHTARSHPFAWQHSRSSMDGSRALQHVSAEDVLIDRQEEIEADIRGIEMDILQMLAEVTGEGPA